MGEYEFKIIDLMNERDMSQAELARRSGITTSSLNRYLAGTDIQPSIGYGSPGQTLKHCSTRRMQR